jgi:beta-lactamase class D
MTRLPTFPRWFIVLLTLVLCASFSFGAPSKRSKHVPSRSANKKVVAKKKSSASVVKKVKSTAGAKSSKARVSKAKTTSTQRHARTRRTSRSKVKRGRVVSAKATGFVAGGPWLEPTFADSTAGDIVDGEDLVVRRAAVAALGPLNGTVVVTDPQTGRILTIVNQQLAFKSGFQPCSTIKIVAALAGLTEGVIDRETSVRLYGRTRMNLTDALAKSNNPYFANVGVKLGYDKVAYYAKMYGLGEKAGLDIEEEQLGTIPDGPPKNGGMGMMTSFGEGIKLTPLQLSALLSAIANGGTLYYLQYPHSQEEIAHFVPRVKRHLPIEELIPDVTPGMHGATEYGTARRAAYEAENPIYGKTGTCTDRATPTHLGWFGSYNEVAGRKLSVVVLLTGGRHVSGPVASGVAGQIYRTLEEQHFFSTPHTISPVALVSGSSW